MKNKFNYIVSVILFLSMVILPFLCFENTANAMIRAYDMMPKKQQKTTSVLATIATVGGVIPSMSKIVVAQLVGAGLASRTSNISVYIASGVSCYYACRYCAISVGSNVYNITGNMYKSNDAYRKSF